MAESELLQQIRLQAAGNLHLQKCLVAAATMEGGNLQGPWPRGDSGCAAGPFQIRWWMNPCDAAGTWKGHPLSAAEAEDPAAAVAYAISDQGLRYRYYATQYPNPIDVVFAAERPARYYSADQIEAAHEVIAAVFADEPQEPTSMVPKPPIVQKSAHPNNIREGRGGKAAECIVVHTMAGTLAGCDSWFANPAAGASAHFGVGRNGEIHQYVAITDTAIANGNEAGANPWIVQENPGTNINLISVSIEHDDQAKPGTAAGFPTPQQFEASAQLAAWIWDAWIVPGGATNLAIDRNHILRHAELAPSTRAGCPGWPEEMLQRYVARVAEIVAGPVVQPPPIDYRAIAIEVLHNQIQQANDDLERAKVSRELRVADATKRLAVLGEKV